MLGTFKNSNSRKSNMEQVHEGHNSILAKLTHTLQLCLQSAISDDSIPNSILDAISQVTKLAQQCRAAHADHEAMEARLFKSLTVMKKGYELQKGEIVSLKTALNVERVSQSTNTDMAACSACLSKDILLQQHTALVSQQQTKILELEQQLRKSRFLIQAQQVRQPVVGVPQYHCIVTSCPLQVLLDERQKKTSAVPHPGKDRTRCWDDLFDDSVKRPPRVEPAQATIRPPLPEQYAYGPGNTGRITAPLLSTEAVLLSNTEASLVHSRRRFDVYDHRAVRSDSPGDSAAPTEPSRGVRNRYLRDDEDSGHAIQSHIETSHLVEDEGEEYGDAMNVSQDSVRSSERSAETERSSADSAATASSASAASGQSMHSLGSNGSVSFDSSGDVGDGSDQHTVHFGESAGQPSQPGNRYGWLPTRYSGEEEDIHTTSHMKWAETVGTESADLSDSFTLIQMCYSAEDDQNS